MHVVGVTMVKDEADIVERVLAHMLGQVDSLIVADNGSTDGTRELVVGMGDERIDLLDDDEVGYFQSRKMSGLARRAADQGADWVVPFDADEFWVSAGGEPIRDVLAEVDESVAVVKAAILNHVCTAVDPPSDDPTFRMCWRLKEVGELPKVACRPRLDVVIEQGNHGAGYPRESSASRLSIHHYPQRSAEQMIRKARNGAAAYAAAPDIPEHFGQHWRSYGRMTDGQIEEAFRQWWWFPHPEAAGLVYDPLPLPAGVA